MTLAQFQPSSLRIRKNYFLVPQKVISIPSLTFKHHILHFKSEYSEKAETQTIAEGWILKIKSNSLPSDYRQLGKTDEWLLKRLADSTSSGDTADRDYFNKWTSGTATNPLSGGLRPNTCEITICNAFYFLLTGMTIVEINTVLQTCFEDKSKFLKVKHTDIKGNFKSITSYQWLKDNIQIDLLTGQGEQNIHRFWQGTQS